LSLETVQARKIHLEDFMQHLRDALDNATQHGRRSAPVLADAIELLLSMLETISPDKLSTEQNRDINRARLTLNRWKRSQKP
jgi:hypothetical protein